MQVVYKREREETDGKIIQGKRYHGAIMANILNTKFT